MENVIYIESQNMKRNLLDDIRRGEFQTEGDSGPKHTSVNQSHIPYERTMTLEFLIAPSSEL
jgi:hypothetical protein